MIPGPPKIGASTYDASLTVAVPLPADFAALVAAATSLRKVASCNRSDIAARDPDHAKHWNVVGTGGNQHVVRIDR